MLLQYGDFLKIGAADDEYGKVFCLNVVYFWDELSKPFKKVYELLKTTGSFYIYMADKTTLNRKKAPDSVFNKYSIEQVVAALNSAGFKNVEHYAEKGYYITARK